MCSRRVATGLIAAVALLGPRALEAGAQAQGTIRVVSPNAAVMRRANLKGDVVAPAPPGTVLEVIDLEGDWYWVMLAPDSNGSRRPGWIRASDVEVVTVGKPKHSPVPPAPGDTRQAEDDRRVKKAKRDLEKARRDYEKAAQRGKSSAAPDAAPASPSGQPAPPK
jgi:hypothetical protein